MTIWRPELDVTTTLKAWWTDNDASCDFCISGGGDTGLSLNLSYQEAKQLYATLREKLGSHGTHTLSR